MVLDLNQTRALIRYRLQLKDLYKELNVFKKNPVDLDGLELKKARIELKGEEITMKIQQEEFKVRALKEKLRILYLSLASVASAIEEAKAPIVEDPKEAEIKKKINDLEHEVWILEGASAARDEERAKEDAV